MKKKLVAIVLSAAMCMAPVLETGAADLFTAESTDAAMQDEDVESDSYEEDSYVEESYEDEQDIQEEGDIFTAGEFEDVTDVNTDEMPEEIPDMEFEADLFSAEAEEETGAVQAADSIVVSAEDWEAEGEKFRLHKTAASSEKAAEADVEVPVAELTDSDLFVDEAVDGEIDLEELEAEDAAAEEIPELDEETTADDAAAVSDYYTAADGILKISTVYKGVTHTGYYLFDEEGYLVTGKKEIKAGTNGEITDTEYYFTDKANAFVYEEFKGEEVNPCSSDLGQQLIGNWAWTGSTFRYYDEDGRFMTVNEFDSLAKENGTYTGYHEVYDGEYFCLDPNGKPRTGAITLKTAGGSAEYYFQPQPDSYGIPGKMFHHGWRTVQGKRGQRWLYYNQGVTNPANIGKLLVRGITATKLSADVDPDIEPNKTYLIDKYGYIMKSTQAKAENGAYYCTDSRGVIYRDTLVRYKGVRYYFGADGKRAAWKNSWRRCPGASNKYYYFGSTPGKVEEKRGWQKVTTTDGKFYGWFYFSSNGNHYANTLTSAGYYFLSSGRLAMGVQNIDGKRYLFAVSDENTHRGKMYKNTLVYHKGRWHYAGADGQLLKSGWKNVNGNWYYFDNYRAVTNKFMKKDGVNGYLDSTGKYTTGWVIVSNSQNRVRYIDPDGDGFKKNGSEWIDGLLYYFDKNGYRINDLTNIYGGPYSVKVDRKNGVMTVYASDGKVPVKSIRVSVGNPWTPTPTGTYTLYRSLRWQPLMGPSWGQYGTHVSGAGQGGIFVHSVSGGHQSIWSLPAGEYNKLGNPASHGCIRACVADAKWVFDHCNGSRITIFDGSYNSNEAMKGPLGRRPLVPLRAPYNFDPTDPLI